MLPFFEALHPKKWYLPNTYFKRKTYVLHNIVFRSSFGGQKSSLKYASNHDFLNFLSFLKFYNFFQNFFISISLQFQRKFLISLQFQRKKKIFRKIFKIYFHKFWNFISFAILKESNFFVLYIKIAFFAFLLPFFEALDPKKWYLPKTYFKRKTYVLYNVVFGSS